MQNKKEVIKTEMRYLDKKEIFRIEKRYLKQKKDIWNIKEIFRI